MGALCPRVNCRGETQKSIVRLTTRPVEPRIRVEVMASGSCPKVLSFGSQILRPAFGALVGLLYTVSYDCAMELL